MATSTHPMPDRFLVHRSARAHPQPLPTGELLVAAPPTVSWPGPATAAWLQYLVPMLGGAGSLAFLFAVPGPRHPLLVVAVAGTAVASLGLESRCAFTSDGPPARPGAGSDPATSPTWRR
jgi:hypothetical protein